MTTHLDNVNYIKDQLSLGTSPKFWYTYISGEYRVYHYINDNKTESRLLMPKNFKLNFLKNLYSIYSSDILKLKTSSGNIFTNN